jgi:metal-responsive CopG/Arc/MetJ family transcriptional regulator
VQGTPTQPRPAPTRRCLVIHPHQLKQIDTIARERLISRSALIREAIDLLVKKEARRGS